MKLLVLVRFHEAPLRTTVAMLGQRAMQHPGLGWVTYAADPTTRGGRFNAALEVYCDVASAAQLRDAICASLPPDEEVRIQTLREVLTLP